MDLVALASFAALIIAWLVAPTTPVEAVGEVEERAAA